MNLIEIVKKKLEAKGWDFSSDYWDDEELAAFYEVVTETEAALRETDVSGQIEQFCPECKSLNVELDYGLGELYCHKCEKLVGRNCQ